MSDEPIISREQLAWDAMVKTCSNNIKNSSETAITMVNEFNRKKAAWQLYQKNFKQTGSVDCTRLHAYKTSNDIFRKKTMQPKGKRHGVIILCDFSGSMSDVIKNTMKNALSIALFCKQANIEFEFYTFTTNGCRFRQNTNNVCLDDVKLSLMFSSKMTLAEIKHTYFEFVLSQSSSVSTLGNLGDEIRMKWEMAGTPLNESILGVLERASIMKQYLQDVSIFLLTDGQGNALTNSNSEVVELLINPANGHLYQLADYKSYVYKGTTYFPVNDSVKHLAMLNDMAREMDVKINYIQLYTNIRETPFPKIRDVVADQNKPIITLTNCMGYKTVTLINHRNINLIESEETPMNKEFNQLNKDNNTLSVINKKFERKKINQVLSNNVIASLCEQYKIA